MNKQKELLNKAIERYNNGVDEHFDNNFKMRQIGYWLNTHSYKLKKECTHSLVRKNYVSYKPGTLLRVDFGVNIGHELCGMHFAIVLDKYDSNKKSTLVVVPLTSTNKPYFIDMKKELISKITDNIKKSSKEVEKKVVKRKNVYELSSKITKSRGIIQDLDDSTQDNAQRIKDLEETLMLIEQLFEETLEFADLNITAKEYLSMTKDEQSQYNNKIKNKENELEENLDLLEEVLEFYQRYEKNSYINATQIKSISKDRIMKRINKFDPMGQIRVDNVVLRQVRNYLNKNF